MNDDVRAEHEDAQEDFALTAHGGVVPGQDKTREAVVPTSPEPFELDPAAEVHPLAEAWPLMEKAHLDELAKDIHHNGQKQPVWVDRDGRLIDGRNRREAARLAGAKCKALTFVGSDDEIRAFLVSQNLHRRHLTPSQRAIMAAEAAILGRGRPPVNAGTPTLTGDKLARAAKVHRDTMQQAKKVLKSRDHELIAQVKQGKSTVNKAVKRIEEKEAPARQGAVQAPSAERSSRRGKSDRLVEDITTGYARWAWHLIRPRDDDEIGMQYATSRNIAEDLQRVSLEEDQGDATKANVLVSPDHDLFDSRMDKAWLAEVFRQVETTSQGRFIFWTKQPQKLIGLDLPEKAWFGVRVSQQGELDKAMSTITEIKAKYPDLTMCLFIEPMLENLLFKEPKLFQWVVVGRANEWCPPFRWLVRLDIQGRNHFKIWHKDGLVGSPLREMPNGLVTPQPPERASEEILARRPKERSKVIGHTPTAPREVIQPVQVSPPRPEDIAA